MELHTENTLATALGRRAIEIAVLGAAAVFEVGGDAMIRSGMRGAGWALGVAGAVTLAAYGVVVNLLPMDFGKLLGTYCGFFAVVSVLFGRIVFGETVSTTTWAGLGVLVLGSAILQLGR